MRVVRTPIYTMSPTRSSAITSAALSPERTSDDTPILMIFMETCRYVIAPASGEGRRGALDVGE
ncbi:hypothetical protein GCM10022254_25120 [Actinomadura meridiana]|uniref:Uncharacterized protein n=1 Tax=Actinomadura meridiana TaxID=559626 RepID=A0ABP8BYE2_9ACTN